MNRPNDWDDLVRSSKSEVEDFTDFPSDYAIIWADRQIALYKASMLALARSNSNWQQGVTDDEKVIISAMISRAEAQ